MLKVQRENMMEIDGKAICKCCGKQVDCGGFADERLIHMRRNHWGKDIGRGWSVLQKLLVW